MTTNETLNTQIPVYGDLPENWDEAHKALVERIRTICNAINVRETGWMVGETTLTGKKVERIQGDERFAEIFRKTIQVGPLPNSTTSNTPHGIPITAETDFVAIWGAASDPVGGTRIPLPYAGANPVEVSVTTTDIVITTTANYSNYTSAYVHLEFI